MLAAHMMYMSHRAAWPNSSVIVVWRACTPASVRSAPQAAFGPAEATNPPIPPPGRTHPLYTAFHPAVSGRVSKRTKPSLPPQAALHDCLAFTYTPTRRRLCFGPPPRSIPFPVYPPHAEVVSSCCMSPDTMGPRMMALPCPAKPNDTTLTPSYSTG